jgi:hypothetical protein
VTIFDDFPRAVADTVTTEPFGVVKFPFSPEILVTFPLGARRVVPAGTAYESFLAIVTVWPAVRVWIPTAERTSLVLPLPQLIRDAQATVSNRGLINFIVPPLFSSLKVEVKF